MRNAVAHNTCILCDLDKKDNHNKPDNMILMFLNKCGVSKDMRNNKLSNSRIRQITYTLFMFNIIVTSDGIRNNINSDINSLFFNRINRHKEYYINNDLLKSIYHYFEKIIVNNYNISL